MPNSNRHSPVSQRTAGAFWLVAAGFLGMMAGAGAPSPVYRVYQQVWGYSPSIVATIFVVYVVALLVALLVLGDLSDRVGRRRVLVVSLVTLSCAMLLFAFARGLPDLLVARALQGLATGTATGAFGASVIDLQPADRAQRGSFVTAVAPTLGPGSGALLSAVLVETLPGPRQTVFLVLAVVYLMVAVLIARLDAASLDVRRPRTPGTSRTRPELPRAFRTVFVRFAPTLIAAWSVGGLFLALAPTFMPDVFGVRDVVTSTLTIFVLLGAGAVTAAALQRRTATRGRTLIACTGLALGSMLLGAGVLARSMTVFLAGCLLTGVAFGAGLFLATAVVSRSIPADKRSGAVSVIFVVNYVAFALPPLLAGICATWFGFTPTLLVYLGATTVLSVVAALALATREGRRTCVN
jgi:MFS family permease